MVSRRLACHVMACLALFSLPYGDIVVPCSWAGWSLRGLCVAPVVHQPSIDLAGNQTMTGHLGQHLPVSFDFRLPAA